ncbi:Uncharacterised protein [Vibrio cholerae]|nr:Uncharacterised protein [Vibrio cholerae]
MTRCSNRHQCITDVVIAHQTPIHLAYTFTFE